jgi:hypothetical protein
MSAFNTPEIQAVIDAEFAAMDVWDVCDLHDTVIKEKGDVCRGCEIMHEDRMAGVEDWWYPHFDSDPEADLV